MTRHARALLLLALLGASGLALSQALYRWTDAQGKTHYGDRPPKDAINVTKIDTGPELNTVAPPAPAPRAVMPASEAPKAAPVDLNTQRRDTRARLRSELNRALENLEAAKKRLADGGEMQDDERQVVRARAGSKPITATARQNCRRETGKDGKPVLMCPVSVPNEQYYDRMAKLEAAVREAEEQVAAAESAYRRGTD